MSVFFFWNLTLSSMTPKKKSSRMRMQVEGIFVRAPRYLPANLAPLAAADLQRADSDDDRALRGIVPADFLNFDWRKEPEIFL